MIRTVVATAVLLALAAQASAADSAFEPVGPIHKFEFDAPDGHYDEVDSKIVCPVNAFRASVHMERYGKPTTEYSPGVNAYLFQGQGPKARNFILSFHATAFRPPFRVTIWSGDDKSFRAGPNFAQQIGYMDRFSFELRWASDGTVRASVDGGQTGVVHMSEAPDRVRFHGFSGAGEVLVQFGYFKSDDKKDPCRPVA